MNDVRCVCRAGGCVLAISAGVFCLLATGVNAESLPDVIIIKGVPHIQQEPDFCGEACIAMWLQKLGHNVTQEDVFNLAGVDPVLGRGCITVDMARVLRRIGFEPGDVRHKIDPRKSKSQLEAQWKILLADLRAGVASIVCMHYDGRPKAAEHFRLVVGYDSKKDEVIYHEPAEKDGAYHRMKRDKFIELWLLKYKKDQWLAIRMSLSAEKIILPKSPEGFTDADYARHIMKLKPTVPKGFTIVLEKPFVVVGDEPASVVRYRADRTVRWFAERIGKLYFKKEPPKIYDIWLFK
ncbi:MAG: C39 family peptidase, partial [Sedimentisphaerales bacterium]|nr:C39 family peptidase [Sedimentisphaerales bacterium]